MTAYERSGLNLAKRRLVLASTELRLHGAIRRAAPLARHVERVRDAHLSYLKALRYELQTGTDVDDDGHARLAAADDAERAWRSAHDEQIIAAYSSGRSIAPGAAPPSIAARGQPGR